MRQVPGSVGLWVLAAVMLTGFGADAQAPVSTPKSSELRQKMQAQLESIAVRLDGVMGYTIIDLTSGERVDRLQNEVFPLASTIKLTSSTNC